MIHRLRGIELGDWRQDAERVASQHHDVSRMARTPRGRRVSDKVERIGDARILGSRIIVEIRPAGQGSSTTFSSTVPKRSEVAKISGSASRDNLIALA